MESEADLSLVERFMSFYFQSLINLTNNFRVSTFVFELSRIDSPKIFPPFPNIRIYIYVYIYICFSKTLYPEKYPAKLFGPDPGIRNVSRLVKLHSSRLLKRILTPQGNTQRYVFSRVLFSWKIIESSDTFGV